MPAPSTPSIDAKYYIAKRNTLWDVYPQKEPEQVVAHDYWGLWARDEKGNWFRSPASYVLIRKITRDEAEADTTRHAFQ